MNSSEILGTLREILRDNSVEEHDWDAVDAATTFEALGIDSLMILDLLYDVEQRLGAQIEASDVVDVETVGQFADVVAQHRQS